MLSLCNVNILALIVATIASLIVTVAWYSDYVLGSQWRSYMGNLFVTKPSTKTMVRSFGIQFVLTLITNFILARVLMYANATTWISGIAIAIALWIGFIAATEASAIIWEKKSWKLVAINSGSYLASLIVAGLILAIWK